MISLFSKASTVIDVKELIGHYIFDPMLPDLGYIEDIKKVPTPTETTIVVAAVFLNSGSPAHRVLTLIRDNSNRAAVGYVGAGPLPKIGIVDISLIYATSWVIYRGKIIRLGELCPVSPKEEVQWSEILFVGDIDGRDTSVKQEVSSKVISIPELEKIYDQNKRKDEPRWSLSQ